MNKGEFPEVLKIAEITPIYKKANPFEKDNYIPSSILSNISKIFERIMHNQSNSFFINRLSKYQCGFRKGFGTQHCLLVMIEKLRRIRDNKGVFEAVFTDLSKAFDCISHELLISKLNAYGFDIKLLNFILACFTTRKQKTKTSPSFSDFLNILFGIPQGSILGTLLFIIYICDLFMEYDPIESKEEVLLGVRIDSDLTFKEHVTNICSKANQKLYVLTRISKYLSLQKCRILMKSFITSQFNNCPIVWMCHCISANYKVNNTHERALRIVYIKVGLSRLRKFLPNQIFPQPCSKKYHHLFVWCLKLKINVF